MQEYNHEGIMCLWLGPTYPLVLIYKPELAEVRYKYIPSDRLENGARTYGESFM